MNPMNILQLKSAWESFTKRHPKFPKFLNAAAKKGMSEGSIIEINITTPTGENLRCNLKVHEQDIELIEELKKL